VIPVKRILRIALIAAAGAIYLGLSYFGAASDHPPMLAVIIGIAPLAAIAITAAWNSPARNLSLFLCVVCAAAVMLNLDRLRDHAAWLYFVQHVGAMAILAATFGGTLWGSHANAFCSRIASFLIRTDLDADYLHYTWKVTLAWTVYFAVSAVLSVLLFFFGPIEAWSLFANVLTPIFVGAMFVGEYLIRLRTMPGRAHFSIVETIQAYREYSRR
jgi:uncharacterized membrane protein